MGSCVESFGEKVEHAIGSAFNTVGNYVGMKPRTTIVCCILLSVICGGGFSQWSTENRPEKLWVPQNTLADQETSRYLSHFNSPVRFNTMIVQASEPGDNVLTKTRLVDVMMMHQSIETANTTVDGTDYDFSDVCLKAGGLCVSKFGGILGQWNYNLQTLQNDNDFLKTLNNLPKENLEAFLGKPEFDMNDNLIMAEALTINYLLEDQTLSANGNAQDPIGEGWEEDAFLAVLESAPETYPSLSINYFAGRSFGDEFGGAITGDLGLVNVSYVVIFLFLGATMGKVVCGTGSRWTLALGALFAVVLSTVAGFGVSAGVGLFFGPVHSLLPFILLGIGVDDAFVIVNAFNRERKVPRSVETNNMIRQRSARALARAGASITVTSVTDFVAFAISASSRLPALASFCAWAAICILFLWFFASTFFTATLVLDERRQRDNRRECCCCLTRKNDMLEDDEQDGFQENAVSRYFRNYHAPAILSKSGKTVVLIFFSALLAFGIYGAVNLSVEDTQREFIPSDSYLRGYLSATDELFPSQGIDLYFVFEGGDNIFASRKELSELDTRLDGLSKDAPFIAEPASPDVYQNIMTLLRDYLIANGSSKIGGAPLGDDNWPTNEADFITTMRLYTNERAPENGFQGGPGIEYTQDISWANEVKTQINAIRVKSEYVRLTKTKGDKTIDDAGRQIAAMDATRELTETWGDLPPSFQYSAQFIAVEGFKVIRRELFQNVGLALLAVAILVMITVGSPVTAILITLAVACCIIDILGFMYALGISIDSVSVINLVLAVGLSVDYSAHVGHCFMVKAGSKNQRALEALADIGAAVLQGATSTFLAVVILLFTKSYVFATLSKQFVLTVGLGTLHGLVLLPVLLSIFGPKSFVSDEAISQSTDAKVLEKTYEAGDQSKGKISEEEEP